MRLKSHHLKRYKDIAVLLFKYGRGDLVREMGLQKEFGTDLEEPRGGASPEELADDLERMGPTFVKLGQLLSSRPDLLPAPYLRALTRLQDNVKPFSFEEVEETVMHELGVRISKAFSRFDREPAAAASLGQVHRAALRDGREVVVKVQRPNIRKQIAEDFEVLEELAAWLDHYSETARRYQFCKILAEFKRTLAQELDYEREAANMISLGDNLREFPLIYVPAPIENYSRASVLTMEYVEGSKITSLSPLARLDVNGPELADQLFKAYLKQVLVDGLFHADPHPGNVFLTRDGRIALLDVGMVGRITPAMQDQLLKIVLAISEGRSEEVADISIQLGETADGFDEAEFRRQIAAIVAEQQGAVLQKIDVGKALLEVSRNAGANGLYVPTELTMLGKALLQLDEIGKIVDPEFDPTAAVRRHASGLMNRRMRKHFSSGRVFGSLLEMKDFMAALPVRLNKILDAVSNAELEVKVKATDASLLLQGFQKIANRITTGLILAALIIGAALLMQVQTSFQIMGYPGLAMLCFMAAAGGGFYLVFNILISDQRDKRKSRR